MDKTENNARNDIAPPEGGLPAPAGQPQPAEEPIELKRIFPNAQQDLDALFPDPKMKELLKEVVENRKRNERFVRRINAEVATEKEESE
jgi:hypothetical protein